MCRFLGFRNSTPKKEYWLEMLGTRNIVGNWDSIIDALTWKRSRSHLQKCPLNDEIFIEFEGPS